MVIVNILVSPLPGRGESCCWGEDPGQPVEVHILAAVAPACLCLPFLAGDTGSTTVSKSLSCFEARVSSRCGTLKTSEGPEQCCNPTARSGEAGSLPRDQQQPYLGRLSTPGGRSSFSGLLGALGIVQSQLHNSNNSSLSLMGFQQHRHS